MKVGLKTLLAIFFFSRVAVESAGRKNVDGIFFKSARCNFSEKFVYQNFTCYSKSYSWTLSTLNAEIIFKKPLESFTVSVSRTRRPRTNSEAISIAKMQATLFYRYGLIYREVLRMPKMNWCHLMSHQAHNLVFKHLIDLQAANFPGTIHECPYKVRC